MLIDTQYLSHAHTQPREYEIDSSEAVISSVTANEFLLTHSPEPTKARYYIPRYSARYHIEDVFHKIVRRDHPFNKRLTD
jgi:hypothetical protein